MCEKRRIHKQCVGFARKVNALGMVEYLTSRDCKGAVTKILASVRPLPHGRGSFIFRQRINFSCAVLLLLVVVMGGCSAMESPWPHNRGTARVATQADLATFNEAVSLVESQHYEEATGKFRQVFDRFERAGDRQRAAESLFWMGFCREKQQRLDEARFIYARVAEEYAGTRAAEQADKRRLRIPAPPG